MEWSYMLEEIVLGTHPKDILKELDELGGGGWEAVAVIPISREAPSQNFWVLFKKPN